MAFAANLPDGAIGRMVDRNLLLITLVVTVVIALFRYLKLMLFITVSVLAIGANLPDQLAAQLGISRLAMIVASGVLVLVALLYKLYHLHALKNNSEHQEDAVCYRHDSMDSRNEVITAILNGDVAALHQLLITDVEINFSQDGHVPIYLAIEKGYADIVLLLLFYGAKLRVRNKAGQTPIEFALLHKKPRIAKIIHYASRQNLAMQNKAAFPNKQKKTVVLFADICGSTALYDKLGNETALNVITRTLNILIQEVATHNGTLIKTIGDEIMCTFPGVAVATQAACAMHFAIDARRPGGEHPVFVRIGFHYGEVIHKANDVFGDTVNVAARVAAITRARQIMTTQAVIDALPSGFADQVRPVTRAAFHGMQDSLAVFQILWEPENTLLGRIGESIFRKQHAAGNDSFGNIQAVDRHPLQIDQQAQ
jgi:class 3 adenylate cyclase